jgi:hypothetical protein
MSLQDQSQKSPPLPPSAALLQMVTGYWISQAISVAAKLGIADVLKNASKSHEELAQTTGVNAQSLYRLLRALASVGVFHEDEEGRFGLTPIAACLCSDVPGSLRAPAIMFGEPWFWKPWGDLLHSVQTGEAAFPQVFSIELFPYLERFSLGCIQECFPARSERSRESGGVAEEAGSPSTSLCGVYPKLGEGPRLSEVGSWTHANENRSNATS